MEMKDKISSKLDEFAGKFPTLQDIENEIKKQVQERLSHYELTLSIVIAFGVAIVTVLLIIIFGIWKIRQKVQVPRPSEGGKKYRFRKRDKVLFYGRKMLRKVRSYTKNTINAAGLGPGGQGKGRSMSIKKKELMILAKKILMMKKAPSQPMLKLKDPPKSFFEADVPEIEDSDHRIPSEVLYMLRSVRVFGHFEQPLFLELCKHVETKFVPAGSYLFKVGDVDDCIFVVQSGKINVYINEGGMEYLVKEVTTGDSIHSLLSILDFLTGNASFYKTVCARAVADATVLKLPASAFQSLFESFPESLVRVVQVIMVRLQRVTFTALHNYLGLSSELINKHNEVDISSLSIQAIAPTVSLNKRHSHIPTAGTGTDSDHSGKHAETIGPSHGSGGALHSTGDDTDSATETYKTDIDAARHRSRASSSGHHHASRHASEELSTSHGSGASVFRHRTLKRQSEPSIHAQPHFKDETILEMANADLVKLLKLKDPCLLNGRTNLHHFKSGVTLIKQGSQDASLIFVVSGKLSVSQFLIGNISEEVKLFSAHLGEMVGALAVLTGEPSFFTIRSKTDAKIVTISKQDFYMMMREQPSLVLNVAHTTLTRLTPFVRQIDFALDWMMVEAGRALFRQGDVSDSIYIVLTGRLRTVFTLSGGKKELVGEYGRGELVGIVEVLTQRERVTTGMAVRDTELAKLPSELLNVIKRKHPHIVTRLIHLLGQRIIGSMTSRDSLNFSENISGVESQRASVKNLATVAILPASYDVPLTNFTLELQHSLIGIGMTTRFTSESVKRWLGAGALDSVNEFRLFSWLGQQEDIHRMILYQCDYTMTRWTKMCIRQADCILIVGLAGNDPKVGELESQMETIDVRAQKELVLLHTEDADTPRGTVQWLNARGWCSSHHHIRCPKRVFSKRSTAKMAELYEELHKTDSDRMSDVSRLARFLTGTSIGLVFGGGGARGLSHGGIMKAFLEAKIPIDMVGGTSIGAFMGALFCEESTFPRFIQRSREWAMNMTSIWNKILDLTYPVASMFTGSSFNQSIEEVFKDRQMEDLWIPFFCVTTDLTSSTMRIHTHGSVWRYVRASMSLAGYLPPLCDPVDGHLLLDGGYVNNLPADVMRSFGAQSIFAVDVGSIDNTELTNYGDKLSGWWLMWKRWNPWAEKIRVPDMTEIQSRLAYVSCTRQLEIVKNSDYCEYIRPPIDKYGTLQFGSYDEIADVGYNHGKTFLAGWEKGGLIDTLFQEKDKEEKKIERSSGTDTESPIIPSMAKFTDLAELVSKIEKPKSKFYLEPNDAEDEDSESDSSDGNYEDYDDDVIHDDDDMYETESDKEDEDGEKERTIPRSSSASAVARLGARFRSSGSSASLKIGNLMKPKDFNTTIPRRLSHFLK